jgi:HTH-type transcriptional regulator / antitoxin HigA
MNSTIEGKVRTMTAYAELLLETEPQIIENRQQYDAIHSRVDALIRCGRSRTPEETKLLRLLSLLIQDYDQRHAMPPDDSSPGERLQYLLEVSGKNPADLLPVFGQRSHVNEALTGKRPVSANQARKLGEIFHLKPGYFV